MEQNVPSQKQLVQELNELRSRVRQLERLDDRRAASATRIDIEGLLRLWTAWHTALRYA